MITTTKLIRLIILSFSISFLSCNKENKPSKKSQKTAQKKEVLEPKKNYSYSEDIKSDYKYSVSGTDYDNNKVHGKIDLEGQNGIGTLIRNGDTTVEIVVENVSHGKLIAIDIDGNKYELKLD